MNWSMIDLRAVREVAELRLPEHERLGRRGRVAVLEADAARTPRAASCRPRTTPRRSSSCCIGISISPVTRVVEDEMPVREGAALGVLAGEPDRDPLAQQRGERERLGVPPVDAALLERVAAALELACELRVDREARRARAASCSVSRRRRLRADGGLDVAAGPRAAAARRATSPGCSWPNEARRRSCASCSLAVDLGVERVCASSAVEDAVARRGCAP